MTKAMRALLTTIVGALATAAVVIAQAAPTLGNASITVDEQIHLGANSSVFKDGQLLLWNDANNFALGNSALSSNTTGEGNTALGQRALVMNQNGSNNTAVGEGALRYNTSGDHNTAVGEATLLSNTTGSFNTASGQWALYKNIGGFQNTAVGSAVLYSNTNGFYNTAIGESALRYNIDGSWNTASGTYTLQYTTGSDNTASGGQALRHNTTGSGNIAIGYRAGINLGHVDPQTGASNYSNNILIGNEGEVPDQSLIRIGTQGAHTITYIAGVYNTPVAGTHYVVVDANGQIGQGPPIVPSSRRYKENVQSMSDSSRLLELHPVTFRFKEAFQRGDPSLQFGLIAEEVAEVLPELVSFDEEGRPEAVKYRFLSSLLLNELQKQATEIRELTARLDQMEGTEPP